MKSKFGAALAVAGSFAIVRCLAGINSTPVVVLAQDDPSNPAYFSEKVKPILDANCYRCHGGSNHRGGYNMNTRELMLKGGRNGAAIVNGQPESSLLVKLVHYEGPGGPSMPMPPPPKQKLSDRDIAVLEKWIKAGAVTPVEPLIGAPA